MGTKNSSKTAEKKTDPKVTGDSGGATTEAAGSTLTAHDLHAAARTLLALTAARDWSQPVDDLTTPADKMVLSAVERAVEALQDAAKYQRQKGRQIAVVKLVHAMHRAIVDPVEDETGPDYRPPTVRNGILGPVLVDPPVKSGESVVTRSEQLRYGPDWVIEIPREAVRLRETAAGRRLITSVEVALGELRQESPTAYEEIVPRSMAIAVSELLCPEEPVAEPSERARTFVATALDTPRSTLDHWLKVHRPFAPKRPLPKDPRRKGEVGAGFFYDNLRGATAPKQADFFRRLLAPLGGEAIARAAMAETPAEVQLVAALARYYTMLGPASSEAEWASPHLTLKQRRLRPLIEALADAVPPLHLQVERQTGLQWCFNEVFPLTAHASRWLPVSCGEWVGEDWRLPAASLFDPPASPAGATAGTLPSDDNPGPNHDGAAAGAG